MGRPYRLLVRSGRIHETCGRGFVTLLTLYIASTLSPEELLFDQGKCLLKVTLAKEVKMEKGRMGKLSYALSLELSLTTWFPVAEFAFAPAVRRSQELKHAGQWAWSMGQACPVG